MKLNNRGFAISSVMYSLLIMAVALMFSIIAVLVSRKMTLDKIKDDVKNDINGNIINTPDEYKGIPEAVYTTGQDIMFAGLNWQVISDNGLNTTLVLNDTVTLTSTGANFTNYRTALVNWLTSNSILNGAYSNGYLVNMTFSDSISEYSGLIRILSADDIYAANPLPTTLDVSNSVISECVFCNVYKDYKLLTRKNSSNVYLVKYNDIYKVNYLATATSYADVRPVITVLEY